MNEGPLTHPRTPQAPLPAATATGAAAGTSQPAVAAPSTVAVTFAPAGRAGADGATRRILLVGVLLLAGMAAAALWYASTEGIRYRGAGGGDKDFSYYQSRYFDEDSYSPQWKKDGLVPDQQEWSYDGAYDYGSYGSKGMRERRAGKDRRPDAIFSGTARPLPDPFARSVDPSGGAPVGDPSLSWTNPHYDPYAGYSNPYANRIRMAYGPGYGRGAYGGGDVLRIEASGMLE